MYLSPPGDAKTSGSQETPLDILRLIFRANDPAVARESFVGFYRRTKDGDMRAVECVQLSELEQAWLPGLVEQLETDGYYGLSPFHRKPRRWPMEHGKETQLRYLTAAAVDLDGIGRGDSHVTQGQAIGLLHDAAQRGEIPPFSVFVDSGRGCWFLWLLCDRDDPAKPPRAHDSLIRTHKRIQRALADKIRRLPRGDDMAPDPTITSRQLVRVPGSINSKSGRRVAYMVPFDAAGRAFMYSLDELADHLQLAPLRLVETVTARATDPAMRPRGTRGQRAGILNRIRDIELLEGHRGGFREGERHRALYAYALHLSRLSEVTREQVRERVRLMASRCRTADGLGPLPFPAHETERAISDALKQPRAPRNWRREKMAWHLRVTPAEAEALAPDGFGLGDGLIAPDADTITPSARALRRAEIEGLVRGHHLRGEALPTCAAIVSMLRLNIGCEVSAETVRGDLKLMGVQRRPRGRPSSQLPLPE